MPPIKPNPRPPPQAPAPCLIPSTSVPPGPHNSHIDALRERAAAMPAAPGVYLYKDARDRIIYVGKAKSLRDRVRSYFLTDRLAEAKTGSLISEARDVEYITVRNEKEALALENNLIKQKQPKFNVLLRDDKTFPYIKLTAEPHPRVYVTRRLKKDGSSYFGPYFPGNLAHRLRHFINRHFKVPSCRIDLTKNHPRACLEYHIKRCWGPCVEGLADEATYQASVADVRAFLEGRQSDLVKQLSARRDAAAENLEFERAASLRDLITTVEELHERQRMAAVDGQDSDIFGLHAEPPLVAVNLFHVRRGRVIDRREYYWEDAWEFAPAEFWPSFLLQLYLDSKYVPSLIHVPLEFEDMETLAELLGEKKGRKVEITVPQRGPKKAMLDLVGTNAQHGFTQRFRIREPTGPVIAAALADALSLEKAPERIECFDISHTQGSETVASMVVWKGKMRKGEYRKFNVRGVANDDFASMRQVVHRRYKRLQDEQKPLPGLVLIDGGLGQLHAAAEALEELGLINQPLASIAKKEEIIYVFGQEQDPVVLDRFSPLLHLVQRIRDEAHRFAITFHRKKRSAARINTALLEVPGIGPKTAQTLLRHFGSLAKVKNATPEQLAEVINQKQTQALATHFQSTETPGASANKPRPENSAASK